MDRKIQEVKESTAKLDHNGRITREVRCPRCNKWLADEYIYSGRLTIQCLSCKKKYHYEFKHSRK